MTSQPKHTLSPVYTHVCWGSRALTRVSAALLMCFTCVCDREPAVRPRSRLSPAEHQDRSRCSNATVCLRRRCGFTAAHCVFALLKAHRPSVYFSCSVEQTDEEPMQQARHDHTTLTIKETVHSQLKTLDNIYSPHCCTKPVWLSFFLRAQKEIRGRMTAGRSIDSHIKILNLKCIFNH